MFLNRGERTLKFRDLTLDTFQTHVNNIKLHQGEMLIEMHIN